jgi:hypothetical protein
LQAKKSMTADDLMVKLGEMETKLTEANKRADRIEATSKLSPEDHANTLYNRHRDLLHGKSQPARDADCGVYSCLPNGSWQRPQLQNPRPYFPMLSI